MFSKILIITDYILLIALVVASLFCQNITEIAIAWIGQVAISSGFYFWKARQENRVKVPFYLLQSLTEDEQEKLDLTSIITSIIQGE